MILLTFFGIVHTIMRIQKNKKIIYILLSSFLIIGGVFVLEKSNITSVFGDHPNAGGSSPEQEKAAEAKVDADTKKRLIESTLKSNSSNSSETPSIELTAKQEPNDTVTVFTKLTSITSGTCQLVINGNGTTLVNEVEVIYQAQYSTCAGFSVPINAKGIWNINLNISTAGGSYSKHINYEVK